MESEGLELTVQQSSTATYPEPDESTSSHHIPF